MLPRRRQIVRVLLNPLVVIPVVVAMLATGWVLYIGSSSGTMAQARAGANLLPPLVKPALGVIAAPSASAPGSAIDGWSLGHSGDSQTSLGLVDGQVASTALKLDVSRYSSGDVTLTSPRTDLQPGKKYLFKAFATSDTGFTMLARRHYADGSTTLEQLKNPLQQPSTTPFTVSDAFDSGSAMTGVEYVFKLASTGSLRVEDAYLEPAEDVRVPPAVETGPNLIPNLRADSHAGAADQWSPYSSGTSTVVSGRGVDKGGAFLWTRIANYQYGEAKWQYPPLPVTPDRYFQFGATYRAERQVDVVAEFELANGGRSFRNVATVSPAGEWTTISEAFQAPPGAKAVMVTLVSHGNGTTSVRGYTLTDITKPGPLRWEKPMVSISFDDGWQSVFDRALPLLDKHNFKSTQYINASSIETQNFMTAAELQQLHQAGHEIAAHSYEHLDLTSIGTDRLDEQLRKGEEALAAAGLSTRDLAYPYGRSDAQVDWYASKYFDVIRGTDDGINTRQNLDPHDLKVLYVTDETTQEQLAEALAETSRLDGWLVIVYHQIVAPASSGQQEHSVGKDRSTITSDVFAAQLQAIDDSGITVQPVGEAFRQLQGQ